MKQLQRRAPQVIVAVALTACLAAAAPAQSPTPSASPKPDPWQPMRRFVGSWEGQAQGQPGTGQSEREYHFTLGDRFIQVNGKSSYEPREKQLKGEVHEDVGFISYDKAARKLVMRQFHVEGFVNHYVLESISEDGLSLVFTTVAIENIPSGWRGRETYRIISDDEFVETFALAEPGKEFVTYSETRFRRKR